MVLVYSLFCLCYGFGNASLYVMITLRVILKKNFYFVRSTVYFEMLNIKIYLIHQWKLDLNESNRLFLNVFEHLLTFNMKSVKPLWNNRQKNSELYKFYNLEEQGVVFLLKNLTLWSDFSGLFLLKRHILFSVFGKNILLIDWLVHFKNKS